MREPRVRPGRLRILAWRLQEEAAGQGSQDGDDSALPEEVEAELGEAICVLVDKIYNHGLGWVWDQV